MLIEELPRALGAQRKEWLSPGVRRGHRVSLRSLQGQEGKGIRGVGTACAKAGGHERPTASPYNWRVVAEERTKARS